MVTEYDVAEYSVVDMELSGTGMHLARPGRGIRKLALEYSMHIHSLAVGHSTAQLE